MLDPHKARHPMATIMFPLPVTNCTVVHAALLISIVLVYRRLFIRRNSPLDPLPYPDVSDILDNHSCRHRLPLKKQYSGRTGVDMGPRETCLRQPSRASVFTVDEERWAYLSHSCCPWCECFLHLLNSPLSRQFV